MNSQDISSVIFVSIDERRLGSELIEILLGKLPEHSVHDNLIVYPWHISTKYYEVDVNLCVLSKKELQSREFSESTEAVVLYFDCESSNWKDKVNSWLPFLNEFDAEIKVLLCTKCTEDGRNSVQEWCLKEKYELVELDGVAEDEDFPETVGIARVKQALEAHVWPNLTMKDKREPRKVTDLLSGLKGGLNSDVTPLLNDEAGDLAMFLSDALQQDDSTDMMSFENLFSQLMTMKQKAAGLTGDMRKDFAEKVVTAYWNAIGGDSDELADDSSISEEEPPDYKKL